MTPRSRTAIACGLGKRVALVRRVLAAASAVALLAGLAGCLSVPDEVAPMCETTTDCAHADGEVCEEGVCWGNPPAGMFAAVISPPSTSRDLVPSELPQVTLPGDGWMGDLRLEAPVRLNGRIVAYCPPPMLACDPSTLGATVTVTRRSQFHGGPGFTAVANVESGAESFSIPVPRTDPGDDPYIVTIVPDGNVMFSSRSAAEQVPPRRMQLAITESTVQKTIELGGPALPTISGFLRDSAGQGLGGYRVAAMGRWEPNAPPTEVSTIDYTDDATGAYSVTLSQGLVGTVELVARPIRPETVAATIHLANLDATTSSQRDVTAPAKLGKPTTLGVIVTGFDRNGALTVVRGAQVSISGVLDEAPRSFTLNDVQVTSEHGEATLHLLDGPGIAGSYRLSITPPASSSLGAMFDQDVSLSPMAPIVLSPRIALRGKIVDHRGKPLVNVAVTARPSLRFLWTLEPAAQAFLSAIPASTAVTTPETGEFVLWVDANIAQAWGHYDLMIEPPSTSQAPTYVQPEVDIPRDSAQTTVDVGEITLPEAAYVHGRIVGPDGEPVENAELKLYTVTTEAALCTEVAHAPSSCPIPAQLQGRSASDSKGTVRLALPR